MIIKKEKKKKLDISCVGFFFFFYIRVYLARLYYSRNLGNPAHLRASLLYIYHILVLFRKLVAVVIINQTKHLFTLEFKHLYIYKNNIENQFVKIFTTSGSINKNIFNKLN